jgi:membrane protein
MKGFDSKQYAERIKRRAVLLYKYCTVGVWNETKSNWKINFIKTINLSARSFLDKNLQEMTCALTYRTMLAIVPVLAMLFAIGRGFGFQNLIKSELFRFMPAQNEALTKGMSFVDAYLSHTSEGLFVGIGIIFLLWTLIMLISNVEDSFNKIWGIRVGRNFYRKITDYTSIFLLLPILMICSSGLSIFMSTSVQSRVPFFLSPITSWLLSFAPWVLTWFFFTGAFMLIPNTKVKFKYAFLSGVLCGTVFQLIQMLFVTGQIYVSQYNAIYGSFAFLPLLLIWVQLSWLICLSGVVLTYSSQNIFRFNFSDNIDEISRNYLDEITVVILAIIVKRFEEQKSPYTKSMISRNYSIPIRLVGQVVDKLVDAELVSTVVGTEDRILSYQPAFDIQQMSVGMVYERMQTMGKSNFIPEFHARFGDALNAIKMKIDSSVEATNDMLVKDIIKL